MGKRWKEKRGCGLHFGKQSYPISNNKELPPTWAAILYSCLIKSKSTSNVILSSILNTRGTDGCSKLKSLNVNVVFALHVPSVCPLVNWHVASHVVSFVTSLMVKSPTN